MFKITSKVLMALAPLLVLSIGCNKLKDFGGTNINPGAATNPSPGGLFANVTGGLAGYAYSQTPAYYCQYFSETQYSSVSLYSLVQSSATGMYSGSAFDCVTLQNMVQSTNNQKLAARVAKDFMIWVSTDGLGDIPYSEAMLGIENISPAYDKQEDIYKGLINDLTEISGSFDGSLIFGDVTTFGGDPASWRRLANSLRLLMALRLSNVYPGASDYAATQFKAALADAGGVIESNSQNLGTTYPGGSYKDPLYNLYDGRKDVAESKTMTDLLGAISDARQNVYGGVNTSNAPSTVGVPYGITRDKATAFTDANPDWAYVLRKDLRSATSTYYIVTAAEVLLARAEAADRGWTNEDVNMMYENGIAASFNQWGLPNPTNSYLTQSSVALGATGTGGNLKQIATQRYLASYPDGNQGWAEWRRTGYPELTPAPDAVNASKLIPRRYAYSPAEYNSNGTNVKAAVSRLQGGDTQDSRVWWDQ
ncbi:MAG: SusD/RagB family nutrient-binding outer membrane lipoprotein [Bacteroidetes bacterium]|nr:SusD/RagB family nutrient-binding outer membrane lipoprotein [Bacteroidota bacterium]